MHATGTSTSAEQVILLLRSQEWTAQTRTLPLIMIRLHGLTDVSDITYLEYFTVITVSSDLNYHLRIVQAIKCELTKLQF